VESVRGFELERYLGRWYEIARLDHRFERGLVGVTADYRLRPDGRIEVRNRGYDPRKGVWREARGVARVAGDPSRGQLKVSFFGPFYGGYNVIALDEDYRWAMVVGPTRGYLWILAREPQLDARTVSALVDQARAAGFPTDRLVFVEPAPTSAPEGDR
jgi:apolipoprotein D and lipocalin family protein